MEVLSIKIYGLGPSIMILVLELNREHLVASHVISVKGWKSSSVSHQFSNLKQSLGVVASEVHEFSSYELTSGQGKLNQCRLKEEHEHL